MSDEQISPSAERPPATLELDDTPLTIDRLDSVWGRPLDLRVADTVWARIEQCRRHVETIVRSGKTVYGINTGIGSLCRTVIPPEQIDALQERIILSHAVGVGPPIPDDIARWMLLFKIHALGLGHSGVHRATVECALALLNHDLLPVIPSQGSLGASGDLAPLAHMVLPMIGRGEVRCDGRTIDVASSLGDDGIAGTGIHPIRLGAKEGLALINGTQFMTAYGAALLVRGRRALKAADVIAAMSLEALQGSIQPFDERLHNLRPHPGAVATAANMRRLLAGSEILESHADCDRVQDPYSLRCVAAVHGATRDAVQHATQMIETDINAVTDNPIILDAETAISGGNFHGQPLALALDYLGIALAELAGISERRTYLLLLGKDGLPECLIEDTGINSGFMLAHYTAAALVSENKVLAHPASVDSIPTSLGQEDHVSMGAHAATKAWRIMDHVETVQAIEMMCATQGLDFRAPLKPGIGPRVAHQVVREQVDHATVDRLYNQDMQACLTLLRSQRVVQSVESALGALE